MRNILLTIAYDGSRFHGWQRQPGAVTVQGYLEQTFSKLFGREIRLSGTSRTDAGVHALGQRASMQLDIPIPQDRLARVLNNALCGRESGPFALSPVRIEEAREMPEGFHARFDCASKRYLYRICTAQTPDVFRRNYVYHVGQQLDVGAMRQACAALVGTHDFKSFESAGGNPRQTTVRTILEAEILQAQPPEAALPAAQFPAAQPPAVHRDARLQGFPAGVPGQDELVFSVRGDGFLYNMVRILTGTLVEIGRGKRRPEEIKEIIAAKDRSAAGHTAPPYGLYLSEVYYETQT